MAIIPNALYPGQTAGTSAQYPQGKARDITTPGDGTGTPFVASLVNDIWGFLQSLLDADSASPSGSPDEVGASQYFDAIPVAAEPADNFRLFNRWMADKIQYVALLGAAESYPENTIPAILGAKGMTGVFLEARLTSDDEWILMKDATVDRTTDDTGTVVSKTLATIKALDAGTWKDAYFADTRVPTVEEALLACRKVKLHPIISAQVIASGANRQKLIDACIKFSDGYNFTISIDGAIDEVGELQAYRALNKRVNLMLPILLGIAQGLTDILTMQPAVALFNAATPSAADVKTYHEASINTMGSDVTAAILQATLEKGLGGTMSTGGELIGVEL